MILIPVPSWFIKLVIAAFILGAVPLLLAEWLVEGGIDTLMGKIVFVLGITIEVTLIFFLVDRMTKNK